MFKDDVYKNQENPVAIFPESSRAQKICVHNFEKLKKKIKLKK